MTKLIIIILLIIFLLIFIFSKNTELFVTNPVNSQQFDTISLNTNSLSRVCKKCKDVEAPIGKIGPRGKNSYEHARNENGASDFPSRSMWVHSLKGEKGDEGDPGNDGVNGDEGQIGPQGLSAYEVARGDNPNFPSPSMWINSLKGNDGKSSSLQIPIGAITPFDISFDHSDQLSFNSTINEGDLIDRIPSGWVPCNGQIYNKESLQIIDPSTPFNSETMVKTPDLSDKFIRGAFVNIYDNKYFSLNVRGGNIGSIVLERRHMPLHNHEYNHNHNVQRPVSAAFNMELKNLESATAADNNNNNYNYYIRPFSPTQDITFEAAAADNPQLNEAGNSSQIDITPPYHNLIYIMKI
tara:strand:+ start:304 stop:1362 length:1059 start_codon:yes stop_codon:yes gene_type:complete